MTPRPVRAASDDTSIYIHGEKGDVVLGMAFQKRQGWADPRRIGHPPQRGDQDQPRDLVISI